MCLRLRDYVLRLCTLQTHSVYLIEGLPLFILDSQSLCSLDGPLHVACPHLQVTDILPFDEGRQGIGILETTSAIFTFQKQF